jgi:transcriptional regulator with XRE-family HTH domain
MATGALTTGAALRAMRRARDLSQRELGQALPEPRSQQWVAAVEGDRIRLSLDQAFAVAALLDVPIGSLVKVPEAAAS